jgi:uncharacterized metal-binding protein
LLAEHGVAVTRSIQLENRGVLKAKHVSVGPGEGERIYDEVVSELGSVLAKAPDLQTN